jgi:FAD/FMN-containing dehydrogenase
MGSEQFPDHRYFPGGHNGEPLKRPNWPDPEPRRGQNPLADDVSRLNAEEVAGVFCVRTVDDVKAVLARAREEGKSVSCRGTRHSMGGQSIAPGGFVIDLMLLNSFSFNEETKTVTTQPGATWADLIKYLNQWGYSPRTMQSYSTFSVGGSLAVNAHGITTDHCGAESVIRFTLVKGTAQRSYANAAPLENPANFSAWLLAATACSGSWLKSPSR